MIHVLDAMTAKPGRLAEARELLRERYLPGARARGMRLVGEWVAPDLAAGARGGKGVGAPVAEWILLWGVADVATWWGMRAQASADAAVPAFWRELDARLEARSRRMLPAAEDGRQPEPARRTRLAPETWRGERVTALLTLPHGASAEAGTRLEALARALPRCVPGCLRSEIGRNLPGTLNGGDYTLDLAFDDPEHAVRWLEGGWSDLAAWSAWDALALRAECVHHAPLEAGLDAPGIAAPVKRTLLLRVESDSTSDSVDRLERELAAMPDHIPAIRNWHLARVARAWEVPGAAPRQQAREARAQRGEAERSRSSKRSAQRAVGERSQLGWTHVWSQEFETLDGLRTDYMVHPYHWSVVDRWFDPESPERVVAVDFAHVFCTMPRSVLG